MNAYEYFAQYCRDYGPNNNGGYKLETINFQIWEGIHPTTVFNTGIVWLMGGLAVTWFHNVWVRDWRVMVTLLG